MSLFVCSLVVLADTRYAPGVAMPSCWGIVSRGGSVLSPTIPPPSRHQVAVGFVRVAADSRSSQSAIFYSGSSVYTSSTLEADSIETLAITSDVLLLMVDPSLSQQEQWDHVADSIVRGAARRRDAGFPKLAVLLVATGTSKRDDSFATAAADTTSTAAASNTTTTFRDVSNDSWKERILSERLAALTPDLVASLDIVSESAAEAAYQDVISDLPSKGVVTDLEEYRLMIQQVYQTLTNKECGIVFDTAESSFFESRGDKKVEHDGSIAPLSDHSSAPVAPDAEMVPEMTLSGHDMHGVNQDLLTAAMKELEGLESQQEEVWLSSDAQVPMLHFGSSADSILNKACDAVECAPSHVQEAVLEQMTGKLRVLYNNQLQSLREHFGRKYEKALEENPDDNEAQVEAVARITDGFRVAAQHAIPGLCREGQRLVDADFSYVSSLQGLLSDMMEATSMRQDVDEETEPAEEGSSPTKWYKKVAAQALMVGVNYIQGWLAWQGIKKAAEQRDRDMPKFPLF